MHGGLDDARGSVLPRLTLFGRRAMAVLTLHLHRLRIGTEQSRPHVDLVIQLDGAGIAEAIAQRSKFGISGIEVVHGSLVTRRSGLDLQVTVAAHASFVCDLLQMLRPDVLNMTGCARRSKSLKSLMRWSLVTAQTLLILHVLTEPRADKSGLYERSMAGVASLTRERVPGRKGSAGIRFCVPSGGKGQ